MSSQHVSDKSIQEQFTPYLCANLSAQVGHADKGCPPKQKRMRNSKKKRIMTLPLVVCELRRTLALVQSLIPQRGRKLGRGAPP